MPPLYPIAAGSLVRMGSVPRAISGSALSRWPCECGTRSTTWSASSVRPARSTSASETVTCSSTRTLFASRTFLSGQNSTATCRECFWIPSPLHLALCHFRWITMCQYWRGECVPPLKHLQHCSSKLGQLQIRTVTRLTSMFHQHSNHDEQDSKISWMSWWIQKGQCFDNGSKSCSANYLSLVERCKYCSDYYLLNEYPYDLSIILFETAL